MKQCPWKIRWTFGTDAPCERASHVWFVTARQVPDGRLAVDYLGDPEHRGHATLPDVPGPGSELTWQAGDRREFTGEWPGICTGKVPGCTLHHGHNGRCAP